jgi:hypothetical protein
MSKNNSFLPGLKKMENTWAGANHGGSDDDPSAISTFSQAGSRYGLATLWIAIIAFPILYVLQEMCAGIGIVTGKGLTVLLFILKLPYKKTGSSYEIYLSQSLGLCDGSLSYKTKTANN